MQDVRLEVDPDILGRADVTYGLPKYVTGSCIYDPELTLDLGVASKPAFGNGYKVGFVGPGYTELTASYSACKRYSEFYNYEEGVECQCVQPEYEDDTSPVFSKPKITGVSPTTLKFGTNTNVVLTGTGFSSTSTINVSGTGVTAAVSSATATSITATLTVAGGSATGSRTVTVTSAGQTSAGATVTVAAPSISSISPSEGLVGQQTTVTINGGNFASGMQVNAGTGVTVAIQSLTTTKITATFAVSGSAEAGQRNVTVSFGSTTSNGKNFKVQIPMFFSVVSATPVSDTVLDCGFGSDGYGIQAIYQVLDQDKIPIMKAGMTPREIHRQRNCKFSASYNPFATPPQTDGQGRLLDIPIGTCFTLSLGNVCVTVDQLFQVEVGGAGTYPITTATERRDCSNGLVLTVKNGPTVIHSQSFGTPDGALGVCIQ